MFYCRWELYSCDEDEFEDYDGESGTALLSFLSDIKS